MTIELPPFESFAKIPRLSREIIVTEKIDGTNGVVYIPPSGATVHPGSKNRWITPEDDHHGFAKWVQANADELSRLGPGLHHGEWWGSGIARRYGLPQHEKRFSLFNTSRWTDDVARPSCCHVTPVLYQGPFDTACIDAALADLAMGGSVAAPGFMDPEGVIIFHTASQLLFKKTIKRDEVPKSLA